MSSKMKVVKMRGWGVISKINGDLSNEIFERKRHIIEKYPVFMSLSAKRRYKIIPIEVRYRP